MADLPEWTDQQLSNDLPKLRSLGESQEMEYMESFPQQARDLGKEIAAFATCNTGTILLGVSDDGDLVGLDADTVEKRDVFVRRIEGICRGNVKPSVTPKIAWAIESSKTVLIMSVAKGSEPVYYCGGMPYIRHLTAARPAEPHEIIEFVRKYLETQFDNKAEARKDESELYSNLARIISTVLLWTETPPQERNVNPWLEEWRTDAKYAAAELFDLAAKHVTSVIGLEGQLRELADTLDNLANLRLHLGSGQELDALSAVISRLAFGLKTDILDRITLTTDAQHKITDLIRETSKKLSNLSERSQELAFSGRVEELKENASNQGRWLLRIGYTYNLGFISSDFGKKLLDLGMKLHRIGAMRLYMDGGRSLQNVVDEVQGANKQMASLLLQYLS
jgi:ATP-dependent DNA helicase RecG